MSQKEHFKFLDSLRLSGNINMFGARPVLQEAFGMTQKEATKILAEWMVQFKNKDENSKEGNHESGRP